ncbi:MAG: hypothetical protein JSV91_15740 [Phycisphaerales bacterium]|nr:MAG: hypothetical protein JSV91_15740 [Phycisphaerales bacterium]
MPTEIQSSHKAADSSVVETIQSLVVAFVLAMTFRSFVTEGFVIPTGSMAPTLLGEHVLWHSDQTGATFPIGWDGTRNRQRVYGDEIKDPMLGDDYKLQDVRRRELHARMGDRVLVLKSLYLVSEPDRFDVVVFKNPTDPTGDAANYIKRLIGLPSEKIWLADGDVFAGDASEPGMEGYSVQRKPEHVQRAVWQPVYDSDYFPVAPAELAPPFDGPQWRGEQWETDARRSYVCRTAEPTSLTWDNNLRRLSDWNSYNMLMPPPNYDPDDVSDVRISAAVVADDPAALGMTLRLKARRHVFEFIITSGQALVRMRPDFDDQLPWETSEAKKISLPGGGKVFNVEFWHVDQSLAIFIDGKRVAGHEYEWTPAQRLMYAADELFADENDIEAIGELTDNRKLPPAIEWSFQGSPVTLHRVRLDRDLYYKVDEYRGGRRRNSTQPGFEHLTSPIAHRLNPAYGTHPLRPAVLNSDQFFMLGDNSAASSDGRLWGNPHSLVATQIDPAPFVVNRKLLLGKAWVVYFPAPHPVKEGGPGVILDFGRLRFIR